MLNDIGKWTSPYLTSRYVRYLLRLVRVMDINVDHSLLQINTMAFHILQTLSHEDIKTARWHGRTLFADEIARLGPVGDILSS